MKNFIIPGKVQVGYQKRSDTYTDALGFITYVDDLGKVKFENSWNGWKDDKISTGHFDNVPTEGFVLNKNSGKQWGHFERAEFVRVYDPRGHEFEISIDNLMKIILHNGISKGNGIEGKFIYGWEFGKRKISLIPVDCDEYKEHIKKTEAFKNMTLLKNVKEIVPGFTYKTKANNVYAYIGHLMCYVYDYYNAVYGKRHIFYDVNTGEFTSHKTRSPFTHKLDAIDIDPIMDQFSTSTFNTDPKCDIHNAKYDIRKKYMVKQVK